MNNIQEKINLHQKYYETHGKEGEKMVLDEDDIREVSLDKIKCLLEASILQCNFNEMKLHMIDFSYSKLYSSSFKKCNILGCDFYKTESDYTDFSFANITNTRFLDSEFMEANFSNANLRDCSMIATYLEDADFSNANLFRVNFFGACFDNTIFKDVKLESIIGLEKASIYSINIGTVEEQIILEKEEARQWLMNKNIN